MLIELSPFTSAEENLRLEQQILTERETDVLLLYRNTPSVIIGKCQQMEAEVNLDYCRQEEIEIHRRMSGGGAVYHDLGNINWAFVSNRNSHSLLDSDPCRPLVDVLRKLGIEAEVGKRNEIMVNGRKVSGTAAQVIRNRQLFHGTLLHNCHLERLTEALKGDPSKRGTKVASVPSAVMNLSELPNVEKLTERFLSELVALFQQHFQ